jgi:hypothetical protein
MNPYFLNRCTSFCATNDGIVFLNMRINRYFGLDKGNARVLQSAVANWPSHNIGSGDATDFSDAHAASVMQQLTAHGILTTIEADSRVPIQPSVRSDRVLQTTGLTTRSLRITYRQIVTFLLSVITVWVLLRLSNLQCLVERLDRRNKELSQRPRGVDEARVRELVAAFRTISSWTYTRFNQCLFDSLVMSIFMQRCNVPVTFIIGVSSRPFAAHAWVQFRDAVLNDSLERIDGFTPIVAV